MTSTEPRSPFTRRGFIAAAIVVGIIVLAAIVVVVTMLTRGAGNGANPPASAPLTSASPSIAAADESVCGLNGFDKTDTLTTAPNTTWELVGTVAAPSDPNGAGPGKNNAGLRTCYAHTTKGALYMAANFIAMGSDAELGPQLTALVAPGLGRDALEKKSDSTSTSSSRAQVAGYKIGGYTGEEATVDLVMNYSNGSLVSLPLKLTWVEGDWKVQLTDTGDFPLAPAQIENLGGYTPWSGA